MTAHAILPIYRQARAQGVEPREARAIAQREMARIMSALNRMGIHAPGPWHVASWADEHRDGTGFADHPVLIADRRGYIVAAVTDDAPMGEANASAARIVECVNAFAGIADPAAYLADLRGIAALLDAETRP